MPGVRADLESLIRIPSGSLTVRPDNVAARTAYDHWGYRVVGRQQPFPDSPVYETRVLEP